MPSIVRVAEDYAIRTKSLGVQDALVSYGEECIALHTYRVNEDLHNQPRCPNYDDVYSNDEHFNCTVCFGTTFVSGVQEAQRVWSIFTDAQSTETMAKQGVYNYNQRQVQVEAYPHLRENDFLIRVKKWHNKTISGYTIPYPSEFGERYRVDVVTEVTIRTGSRYGQTVYDKIGQRANVSELPKTHPIYLYNPPEPILRVDERYVP